MKKNKRVYGLIMVLISLGIFLAGFTGIFSIADIDDDYRTYDDFLSRDTSIFLTNDFLTLSTNPCGSWNTYPWYPTVVESGNCVDVFQPDYCQYQSTPAGRETKTCTGEKWITEIYRAWDTNNGGRGNVYFDTSTNKMTLSVPYYSKGRAELTSVKDFNGGDVKALVRLTSYSVDNYASASAQTFAGVLSLPETYRSTQSQQFLLEARSSRINPNEYETFINGLSSGKKVVGADGLKTFFIVDRGILTIDYVKYRLPFSCVRQPNDLLGMETFKEGDVVDIDSFTKEVRSFCLAHPVVITSSQGSTTSAEPYLDIIQGKPVQVPSGQTWTLFYIFENDGTVNANCGEGAYNVETQTCNDLSGIVYFCKEGTYDHEKGVCTVAVEISWDETKTECERLGGIWNDNLKVCENNFSPAEICSKLGYSGYDTATGECFLNIREPEQEAIKGLNDLLSLQNIIAILFLIAGLVFLR